MADSNIFNIKIYDYFLYKRLIRLFRSYRLSIMMLVIRKLWIKLLILDFFLIFFFGNYFENWNNLGAAGLEIGGSGSGGSTARHILVARGTDATPAPNSKRAAGTRLTSRLTSGDAHRTRSWTAPSVR